jgi:tRNA threonylcarbamoyladenosine biosynthesis protein TsaE
MKYRFIASGEHDTVQLAEALARLVVPGTVFALDGDLGAGKTRFSKALAKVLGVKAVVNSPTFTIIKEYAGAELPFYHMDVYRINQAEADELGLEEYFYGDGVSVVEWASLIPELLPEQRLDLYIANLGDTKREFILTPQGEPYSGWCDILHKDGWIS